MHSDAPADGCLLLLLCGLQASVSALLESQRHALPQLRQRLAVLLRQQERGGGVDVLEQAVQHVQHLETFSAAAVAAANMLDQRACSPRCEGSCNLCKHSNYVPDTTAAVDVLQTAGLSQITVQRAVAAFEGLGQLEARVAIAFGPLRCMEQLASKLAVMLRMVTRGDEQLCGMALYVASVRPVAVAGELLLWMSLG
jgi:hypothetical protein